LSHGVTIEWLVKTFGPRRAFESCMSLGGLRLPIPGRLPDSARKGGRRGALKRFFTNHELAQIIDHCGDLLVKWPLAKTFCINVLYWSDCKTTSEIARALHISEDTVQRSIPLRPPVLLAGLKTIKPESRAQARAEMRERGRSRSRTINEELGLTDDDVKRYGARPA
jgi:hypothetical protein